MLNRYWATNGKTIWFRHNGKVFVRKVLRTTLEGFTVIRYKNAEYVLSPIAQRNSIEDIMSLHKDLRYTK